MSESRAESFISKVINARLKYAGINVKVSRIVIDCITKYTNSNPGYSLVMLGDILYHISRTKFDNDDYRIPNGYTITLGDLLDTWPSEEYISKHKLEEMWDNQKLEDGANKVDTIEYWQRCAGYIKI